MIMKKVVLLAPTPPPAGGIAGWTARMLKANLKNGWKVEVVDEKCIGNREVFGKSGKRHLTEEIKRSFFIWKGLRAKLNDSSVAVVQSCIPAYTLSMAREYVCACITRINRRKFILHFRCTVPNAVNSRLQRFILKKICHMSDYVFVLNEQSKVFIEKLTNTPVRLVPNFVSEDEIVEPRHIHEELKRIVYVGGLVENKGIREILDIAERLPNLQFVFVGKGDKIFEDEAKIRNLSNTLFIGGKDHAGVKDELINADAFIFLTRFRGEGFSNSLCEAMAAGLPCIVTDWAANRDMIGDSGGIVVSAGNVNDAVSAIESIRDMDIRRKMSINNIYKVKSEYIESVVVDKMVDIYESLLQGD